MATVVACMGGWFPPKLDSWCNGQSKWAEVIGAGPAKQGQLQARCCFYGWVVLALCIFSKILKCQGQNNFMTYTVPHLLKDFGLNHSELGGLFSLATFSASLVQPMLGSVMDRHGGRACIPLVQVVLAFTLLGFSLWVKTSSRLLLYAQEVFFFFFLRAICVGCAETFTNACVQQWFVKRRGRAMAVLSTGTQLGLAAFSGVVSGLVDSFGWRFAARVGALANLAAAPVSLLLLRRSPEACGLLPDGDTPFEMVAADPEAEVVHEDGKAGQMPGEEEGRQAPEEVHAEEPVLESDADLPPAIWPMIIFTYFYAVIFGGCDFYMYEMVEEAGGIAAGVDTASHVFAPLAVVTALSNQIVGELMDKYSEGHPALPPAMILLCGVFTTVSTLQVLIMWNKYTAVAMGICRGLAGGIFVCMLGSGLAFSALGVRRERIGRVLGINQFATLAGTGTGPLVFGTYRDMFGVFRGSLVAVSIPPLILSVFFAYKALEVTGRFSNTEVPTVAKRRKKGKGEEARAMVSKLQDEDAPNIKDVNTTDGGEGHQSHVKALPEPGSGKEEP